MNNPDTYKHYIRDLVFILKERRFEQSKETKNDEFNEGIAFAFNSILDTMKNQADSFQIELKEIGFDDFENYQNRLS